MYGWLPHEVDALPLRLVDSYMPIAAAIAKERNRREEQEAENAK